MHLPWWGWVLVAGAFASFFVVRQLLAYRVGVRDRFVAFLREAHPELQIMGGDLVALAYRTPDGGQGTIVLRNLYSRARATKTPTEERAAFEQFATAIVERHAAAAEPLSLERCGDRLRPMLALPAKRQQLPTGAELPFTPLPSLGLEILYAVDGEHSVGYVTEHDRQDLGLAVEELHARAMDNLRAVFPAEGIREALAKPTFTMVRTEDGYDATRLLLLAECRAPGQTLAAAIPDRDTLAFGSVREDGDWRKFDDLARTPSGPYVLLDRPVKVTADGFELR